MFDGMMDKYPNSKPAIGEDVKDKLIENLKQELQNVIESKNSEIYALRELLSRYQYPDTSGQ